MEVHDHEEKQHNNTDIVPVVFSSNHISSNVKFSTNLKINIPSYKEEIKDDSLNDGFKTPTSEEHKIPAMLSPPPRKPKQLRPSTKRKGCCRPQILLDLTQEIESLFPFNVDLGSNGKNKKVKLLTNS